MANHMMEIYWKDLFTFEVCSGNSSFLVSAHSQDQAQELMVKIMQSPGVLPE